MFTYIINQSPLESFTSLPVPVQQPSIHPQNTVTSADRSKMTSSSQTSNGGGSKSPSSSINQQPKASKSEGTYFCENEDCSTSKLWSLLHVYHSHDLGFTRKDNMLRHMRVHQKRSISRYY